MNNDPATQVFDTLAQAAAALGVRSSIISRAKKEGAPGFKSGRVIGSQFVPWFREWQKTLMDAKPDDATTKDDWERLRVREQYRKLKLANDIKDGELVPRAEMMAELRGLASEGLKVLSAIPNRMATELAGLGAVEIEARLKTEINKAIVALATTRNE